nr:hypothetical protein [Angustibacter aerolatus]
MTWVASAGAAALTLHGALNGTRLRTPPTDPPPSAEWVSVLLPLRDEEHRAEPALRALVAALDQPGPAVGAWWCSTTARATARRRSCAASWAATPGCGW